MCSKFSTHVFEVNTAVGWLWWADVPIAGEECSSAKCCRRIAALLEGEEQLVPLVLLAACVVELVAVHSVSSDPKVDDS